LNGPHSRAKDREIGQVILFDRLGAPPVKENAPPQDSFEVAPKAPPVPDFEPQKKLQLEKELLGFYISDHPLKSVQKSARILAPVNVSELGDYVERGTISAIVMLSMVKPVVTKKGANMAIVQVEDLTGQADGVVFSKTYERVKAHIVPDFRLMVWGKVDLRDDSPQLISEDVDPIEEVRLVMVELNPTVASDITQQHRLRNILLKQRGEDYQAKTPVLAVISNQNQRQIVRLGAQFRVQDHKAAVNALVDAGFQARSSALVG